MGFGGDAERDRRFMANGTFVSFQKSLIIRFKISTISGLNLDTTQGLVVGRMSNLQVEILNLTDGQLYTCDQSKLMPGDFVNFTPV